MADNLGMMFGASSGNVNVNRQGSDREQLNIKSIAAGRSDAQAVADGLNGILQSVPQIVSTVVQAQKVTDDVGGKEYWRDRKLKEDYVAGTDTVRAEIIEAELNNLSKSKSDSFMNSFKNASGGEYFLKMEGRNKEKNIAIFNQIGSYMEVYNNEPWIGPHGYKETNTTNGELVTNKDKDATPEQFVEWMSKNNPSMNKADIRNALLANIHKERVENIQGATTLEELIEVLQLNEEDSKPFQNPLFLLNTSPEVTTTLNSLKKIESNALTSKYRDFVINSSNKIATSAKNDYVLLWNDVDKDAKTIAFDTKTGKLDVKKYENIKTKYLEQQDLTWEKNNYLATYDPTRQLTAEEEANTLIKKVHPANIANSILTGISANIDVTGVVQANAPHLEEAKRQGMNILFNKNIDPAITSKAWKDISSMLESPTGYTNAVSIFGKNEVAKISGVQIAQQLLSIDRDTAIDRVNKWKDSPDQERFTKDANIAIEKLNKDYGPLQDEFKTIVEIAVASGTDAVTAVDEAAKLMDKNIVTIGGVPGFAITGQPPTLSDKANGYYEESVKKKVEEFSIMNGGLPIQLEILNDGKAIVRDSTFGYKLAGVIDLKSLAKTAEESAVLIPPSVLEKGLTRQIETTTQATVGVVRGATNIVKNIYGEMNSPYTALATQVYDFFNPKTDKQRFYENKRKAQEKKNQAAASQKILEEPEVTLDKPPLKEIEDSEVLDRFRRVEEDKDQGYLSHRPGSNYFGRYQIGFDTAKDTFKKTGLNEKTWMTPEGQEMTMQVLLKGYKQSLSTYGIEPTIYNLYLAHNQGVAGAIEILDTTKPLTKKRISNMKNNLPGIPKEEIAMIKEDEIRDYYLNFWREHL